MRALVIGSSGGIGAALLAECAARGMETTPLSRRDHGLDLADEGSVERTLAALDGVYDLILVATGALALDGNAPEKSLRQLSPAVMARQFAVNAIGPALVVKHALRLMPRNAPATLAVLSARVGSIGDNALGGWYSYRAAKAALNQLIHTAAIEIARTHPQAHIIALHPGTVDTALTAAFAGSHPKVTPATAAKRLVDVALARPATGGFYDYAGLPIAW